MHNIHSLVESHLQVRLLCEERIIRAYDRARSRVDRHYAIVLRDLLRKSDYLIFLRVSVRLVHESERSPERSSFHRFAHIAEFLLDLLFCIRSRIIARHARSYRALADQRNDIHKKFALGALLEVREASRILAVEQPSAYLIAVRSILIHAKWRETAVARYLSGYALLYERFIELFRILSVIEEIVVRMCIDEPRANLISADIYSFAGFLIYIFCNLNYTVVLDQHITLERSSSAAVIYHSAFEQCFQRYTSFIPLQTR